MAQKNRFRDAVGQFPVHYEKGGIRVYTNPCGELFVEQVVPNGEGVNMRFDPHTGGGLRFTAFGFHVEPEAVSNSVGWRVSKR